MTPALHPVFAPVELEVRLVLARLDRAEEQVKAFGESWARYLDEQPHSLDHAVEEDGTLSIRLRRARPLPAELSIILGELLYELRAALDNCLFAVAALVSSDNPPPNAGRLEWPIRSTPAEWKAQSSRYDALPQTIVTALQAIQPFRAEYPDWNCLAILHDLSRIDRHRSMHGLGLYLARIRLFADTREIEVLDQGQPGIIRPGDAIVRLQLVEGAILSPANFDLQLEFEVDVDGVSETVGPGGVTGRPWGPLEKRLGSLLRAVRDYTTDLLNIAAGLIDEPVGGTTAQPDMPSEAPND